MSERLASRTKLGTTLVGPFTALGDDFADNAAPAGDAGAAQQDGVLDVGAVADDRGALDVDVGPDHTAPPDLHPLFNIQRRNEMRVRPDGMRR